MYKTGQKVWYYKPGEGPPATYIFERLRGGNTCFCEVNLVNGYRHLDPLDYHCLHDTEREAWESYIACQFQHIMHWEGKLEEAKTALTKVRKTLAEAEETLKGIED